MMVELTINIVSWVLILIGSGLVLIGSFGFFRLPDFWSRLHAASVIDSGGMILIILGMCFQAGFSLIMVKLFLIAIALDLCQSNLCFSFFSFPRISAIPNNSIMRRAK